MRGSRAGTLDSALAPCKARNMGSGALKPNPIPQDQPLKSQHLKRLKLYTITGILGGFRALVGPVGSQESLPGVPPARSAVFACLRDSAMGRSAGEEYVLRAPERLGFKVPGSGLQVGEGG